MKLPFKPACLPLLLGGLPHRSAAQALDLMRRHAGTILAWPQLPQRSFREQSFVQSAIGFPGLVIDAGRSRVYVERQTAEQRMDRLGLAYLEDRQVFAALAPDDAAGFDELLHQGDAARGALALKGQLMGPISLAAQLTDELDRPLLYDDALFDAVVQHLHLRAAWQEARLLGLNATTIICLDEPFLETVGSPFLPLDWERARGQIAQVLVGVRGIKALYAGGAVDWAEVLALPLDIIIGDAWENGPAFVAAAEALGPFFERGGVLGLGVVPNDEEVLAQATPEGLADATVALAQSVVPAGVAVEHVLAQVVISTAGTLNRLPVPAAERALHLAADVSRLLRQQFGLV